MRCVLVVGAAMAVALGTAGCGGASAPRKVARDARVTGTVQFCTERTQSRPPFDLGRSSGVVKPRGFRSSTARACRGHVGRVALAEPVPVIVSVVSANRRLVGIANSGTDRFSFDLEPGTYTVAVSVNGNVVATLPVKAVAARTTHANLTTVLE